jgi:hypothetical protein
MDRTYSIVGSMGRTATHWITQALNCHPDVFFVHGWDFDPRKDIAETFDEAEYRVSKFKTLMEGLSSYDEPQDRFFDIIEEVGDYAVYGTVHSVVPVWSEPEKGDFRRRNFRTSCLIRHPVQRLQSFVNKTQRSISESLYTIFYYDDLFRQHCRPFTMETLVCNRDAFGEFFSHVTGIDWDNKYWNLILSLPVMGESASYGKTPEDIVGSWPQEWRLVFGQELSKYWGLDEFYRTCGYSLEELF